MRSVLRVCVLVGALAASGSTAAAESAACGRLRQQLTSSSSEQRSGTVGRGAQQQAIELQQTRIKARQAGCTGVLFSRGDPVQCARFERTIDRLSANVERLRSTDRAQPASRSRILASLKTNGCTPTRPRGLLEVLFGKRDPEARAAPTQKLNRVRLQPAEPKKEPKRRSTDAPEKLVTTYEGVDPAISGLVKKGYRTLCVRTCDGYYFPISFSTKPKYFARDQNACSAMCPAGNAKLYYHAVPQQESADMISVAGKVPYAELPNAFNYRNAGLNAVPGCSCHAAPQPNMSAAAGAIGKITATAPARATAISLPVYALAYGLDNVNTEEKTAAIAKTKASTGTDLMAKAQPPSSEPPPTAVRIVGPTFFPEHDRSQPLPPPRDSLEQEEVSTRYTIDKIIATIASDIWRRIE